VTGEKAVSGDLGLLLEISGESDRPALGRRCVHQLTNRREDGADGAIVLGELFIQSRLELRETPGEFLVGDKQLAQLHEGPHDLNVDRDRAFAAEN
jgi:hypothetical protein